jgi:uncharacterized protein DUF4863
MPDFSPSLPPEIETPDAFRALLTPLFSAIAQKNIDVDLEAHLNKSFPPGSALFCAINAACLNAIKAGWMCTQGGEGRRFGRVLEPTVATSNLSVDVVDLTDIVGPNHRHPTGEICLVMPVSKRARFDGHSAGWCVNPPGSEHRPTVTEGRALVLYLLPEGKIEFTG